MKPKQPLVEPKPSLTDRLAALEKAKDEQEAALRAQVARIERLEALVGK